MKKKMIFAAVAAIALISGVISYSATDKTNLNALALANIEALTGDETKEGWTEIHTSYSKDYDYGTFVRHKTFHSITCEEGGPLDSCNPTDWISYVDISK